MNIIFGNYGNGTLALIQWAFENKVPHVFVVSVDTGWAATSWNAHVERAKNYAKSFNFNVLELKSKASFDELVRDRNDFPSPKFQWCPLLLKGMPLLDWLDRIDPRCEATILLAKRRAGARRNHDLPEFIERSEHYGERCIHYPLFQHDEAAYQALITRTGFTALPHRSLECAPCIHSQNLDFQRLADEDIHKLRQLEIELDKPMFAQPIVDVVAGARAANVAHPTHSDPQGCADPYGCGE